MEKNGFIKEIKQMRAILPVYEDRFHRAEEYIKQGKKDLDQPIQDDLDQIMKNIVNSYRDLRNSLVKAENATKDESIKLTPYIKTLFSELIRSDSDILQLYYTITNCNIAIKEAS